MEAISYRKLVLAVLVSIGWAAPGRADLIVEVPNVANLSGEQRLVRRAGDEHRAEQR